MRDIHEFELLYERSYLGIFRAVYALSHDRQLAEDATQEAFARALERWWRLKSVSWADGWVARTALNIARRERRRRRPNETEAARGNPDPALLMDLRRALASLSRRQQEVAVMHYIVDMPVADVAIVLGIAEGTAKAHLSRARESLRKALAEREV